MYKKSFMTEVARFERCNTAKLVPRNDHGLAQFHAYESQGVRPSVPDPYFTSLLDGKAWWEWTLNFLAASYETGNWDGWYALASDFIDDPAGFRQLRARCRTEVLDPQEVITQLLTQIPSFSAIRNV